MQNERVIKRALKEQGIEWKKRKLILYSYVKQYDELLRYVDLYKKARVEENLHYMEELLPAIQQLGYDIIYEEGKQFVVRK